MGGAKKRTWIGGTIFVAFVMAAATWFLAVSPTLASASEVRDQAQQTREQNDMLEMRVQKLAADFAKLPEYRAQLDALRTQIPAKAQLADYLRQLDAIATAHSVTITTVSPASAQTVVLAAPVAPVAEASAEGAAGLEAASSEGAAADGTEGAAAPDATGAAPVAAPAGLAAIPFSMTAVGTYENVLAFVADLQTGTQRLFLVTGLTGTSQDEAAAAGGRPALADGDLELVVTGQTYVLPDGLAVPPTEEAAPQPLPGAVPGKNPLVPIPGR